jgi:large subunit ribosomal protein L18
MSKCHRFGKKTKGTADRPRLCVYKSNLNVYAQIVDDSQGRTLASASTLQLGTKGDLAGAVSVGTELAVAALKVNVGPVLFDRRGYRYTGKVKALADAARKAGLVF